MPADRTQMGTLLVAYIPENVGGLLTYSEGVGSGNVSGYSTTRGRKYAFDFLTGSTDMADVVYNQAANVVLSPTYAIPKGKRLFLEEVQVIPLGLTPWAGGASLSIQDLAGNLLGFFPTVALNCLGPLMFPQNNQIQGQSATLVSIAASTGVMTFAASTFVTTTLAGVPFKVVAGTGVNQVAGIIASNTATTITPVGGAAAYNGATLDSTSVIEVYYHSVTAATATTITLGKAALPTTVDLRGWTAIVIAGTGIGQAPTVSSNTATVITVPSMLTTLDATSVVALVSSRESWGAVFPGQGIAVASKSYGLQAVVSGTMSGGSNLRLRVKGFIAS